MVISPATGHQITTPLWLAITCMATSAFLGNAVGYWMGAKVGPRLFQREESRFFKKHYVADAHDFMLKHGAKAIVLARFLAIVRSFITAVAGIASMPMRVFLTWSAVGAILWTASLTYAGYALADVPFVAKNVEYIVVGIIVVSAVPRIAQSRRAESGIQLPWKPTGTRRGRCTRATSLRSWALSTTSSPVPLGRSFR
jgi:membrane-associated protein